MLWSVKRRAGPVGLTILTRPAYKVPSLPLGPGIWGQSPPCPDKRGSQCLNFL